MGICMFTPKINKYYMNGRLKMVENEFNILKYFGNNSHQNKELTLRDVPSFKVIIKNIFINYHKINNLQ